MNKEATVTKYQIVATRDGARLTVGDPYDFMAVAELHAEDLRDKLRFVPNAEKTVLIVEPVEGKERA